MILNFTGGARPNRRTLYGKHKIKNIEKCSVICILAEDNARACIPNSTAVKRGTLLGENAGTPVYSSVNGVFRGITAIEGKKYFVVMANSDFANGVERVHQPETRSITNLTREDIIESAKKFAIIDSRSGQPLWKMLSNIGDNCRRLVIDCTETDAECAINYRLCIDKAKSLVGGAKVLIQATGALKCVFAAEYYRNTAFKHIAEYANDNKLFALAQLDEKYPYGDNALMEALYIKSLQKGQTALDLGVFVVAPETVIALYDAMVSGIPQLDRYVSVCFNNTGKGGNFSMPRGMTLHDIIECCGGLESGHFFAENSLLSGVRAKGVLTDKTRALISAKVLNKVQLPCISCGKCAEVCPVRLMPNEVLFNKDRSELKKYCISCGACEFSCPSNIPLLSLIKGEENAVKEA
ncbi:MAG: hypothetical protein J6Q89_01330 [Clostridia bacterium]|nr:hypothetical protein [Clostridia bacterium]